jgi:nucleoside-diphosphate-sugar epimerase
LVIGSQGFIGTNLASAVKGTSIQTTLYHPPVNLDPFNPFPLSLFSNLDFRSKFDIVIDCIGLKRTFYGLTEENSEILDCSKDYYKRFIEFFNCEYSTLYFISSGGTVYGKSPNITVSEADNLNGRSPYAKANIEIEKIINSRPNSIVIRGSNIFGEEKRNRFHQGLISELFHSALKKRKIQIDSLSTVKDYIWVKDFVNIIVKLFYEKNVTGIYNIGTGSGSSTRSIINLTNHIVNDKGLNIDYVLNNDFKKPYDYILDSSKVLNLIGGYKFTDLETALREHWNSILKTRT